MSNAQKLNPNAVWDDSRISELDTLHRLLFEARGLNKSTGIIESLSRIATNAELLLQADFKKGRSSFNQFLREQCIEDRFGEKS